MSTSPRHATTNKSETPEYRVWAAMRSRCSNPNDQSWKDYGGRGITVCDRWQSFDVFIEDMGWRPSPKHEIDRIDNNAGYCPSNCRWVTRQQNCSNTRKNLYITHAGKTKTQSEWARTYGIDLATLRARLKRGMTFSEAVETPVDKQYANRQRLITYQGRTQRLAAWCREYGIQHTVVVKRIRRGWSIHDALTKPVRPNGHVSAHVPSEQNGSSEH